MTNDKWLNRTVVGAGVTSLLADVGYEMATAVLPGFLLALSLPGAALTIGLIDGVADLVSNIAKLGSGWLGDRIGRRKPFVVAGYALTGSAYGLWVFAEGLPLLVLGKALAWFGKGIRGPLRSAILAEAVSAEHRGKAFGLHRAADTVGAVLGPLIGAGLIAILAPRFIEDSSLPYRWVFALTLIPGLGAAVAFALLVRERARAPGGESFTFRAALSQLPTPFRRYLIGVGLFGLGDCSRTLIVLAAAQLLAPAHGAQRAAELAALLYAGHNAVQAVTAFPVGWLSDHLGRRGLLAIGYLLGAAVSFSLGLVFAYSIGDLGVITLICAGSGMYVAIEESLESALAADLVPDRSIRGTAFGVLGVVNGLGDFLASAIIGALWAIAPQYGFCFSAAMMMLGAAAIWRIR